MKIEKMLAWVEDKGPQILFAWVFIFCLIVTPFFIIGLLILFFQYLVIPVFGTFF